MGKTLKISALILLLAMMAGSCNTSGCLDNGSAIPLAGFYDSRTGKSMTLDSIAIVGLDVPNDSVLHYPGRPASQVYLPMNASKQSTTWTFGYMYKYLEGVYDDITFEYESVPYFASDECGAFYVYRINNIQYTRNLIDSIVLVNPQITNADIESIKIYFRTADAEEGKQQ